MPDSGEERKLVSVLFVDMVGSTAQADGADPEDVRDLLRRFYRPVRDQVERYGGTVEKYIGDAVVAVFGAPIAYGDDAERAVRCGLGVVEAVRALRGADPGFSLAVRAAVATGEAVVSPGDAHERGEPLATGDVMNTAARLQSAAPAGGVVVSAETHRATRRAIHYEALPPVAAKGKAEPVETWLALGPVSAPATAHGRSPLIGREAELGSLLVDFEAAVRRGGPHLAVIRGEAGIGKSRLALEFAHEAERRGARIVRGRCYAYERGAYQASVEQIKLVAGILETDASELARRKLTTAVAARLPEAEVADISRYLALLIGLGGEVPVTDRSPLLFAARRLFESGAAEGPVVLVFEDLHWADQSQLDLLDHLLTAIAAAPIFFLVLARPELEDRWVPPANATATLFELAQLTLGESVQLAETLAGAALPPAEAARLAEVSGGNPLFLEELAIAVSEQGRPAGRLPATVRELVASRIDALPEGERALLLAASVIGRNFWPGLLAEISGQPETAANTLKNLVARDLVRPLSTSRVAGDAEYSFKHMVVCDVAYATLTRAARRSRHAAVAAGIERRLGDRRELAALLAHHWREAGEREKAIDYLLLAAERAREAWAQQESISLYTSAIDLLGPDDFQRRIQIRLLRALAYVGMSSFEEGLAELRQLIPDLADRDRLEALIASGLAGYWVEDTALANRSSDDARQLAERLGDQTLLAAAISRQARARILSGELRESRALAQEARRIWVPGSRQHDFAMLNEIEADVAYWQGEYEAAEVLARAAFSIGGESHSVEPLLRSGAWRGLQLHSLGRSDEAIAWLDSIYRRAREVDLRWGAPTQNYLSLVYRDLHMLDRARHHNERALEIVRDRAAWGMPQMMADMDILQADLMEGELGRVERQFDALWEAALNGKGWRPWLGGGKLALIRTEWALREGRAGKAEELARDAIERAGRPGRPKWEAAGLALLGEAQVALGRPREGAGALRSAVTIADRLGSPAARWRFRAALARAHYEAGDDQAAEAAHREAATIIGGVAAGLSPELAAAFLAAEPVRAVLSPG